MSDRLGGTNPSACRSNKSKELGQQDLKWLKKRMAHRMLRGRERSDHNRLGVEKLLGCAAV